MRLHHVLMALIVADIVNYLISDVRQLVRDG